MMRPSPRHSTTSKSASNSSKLSQYLDFGSQDVEEALPGLHTLSEVTEEDEERTFDESLKRQQTHDNLLDETLVDQGSLLGGAYSIEQSSSPGTINSSPKQLEGESLVAFSRSKQLLDETLFEQHVDNQDDGNDERGQSLDKTLAELQHMDESLAEPSSFDRSSSALLLNETLAEQQNCPQEIHRNEFVDKLGPMYEFYRSDLPSQIPEILFFIRHDGKCDMMLADILNELAHALYECPEPTCQAMVALGVMSCIRKRIDDTNLEQQLQTLRVMDGYCRVMNAGKDIPHLVEHAIVTGRRFPSNNTMAHLAIRILNHAVPVASSQEWFPTLVKSKMIDYAAKILLEQQQWSGKDLRLQQSAVQLLVDASKFPFLRRQATFERAGAIAALQTHV
ncbi:expressed unknown protein (Partial), partial [Seminavis robusta]|eukprot:Sro85_g045550.1 n/a (392) ;mRNA; f:126815-127991